MDGREHGGTLNAETDDDTADTCPVDHTHRYTPVAQNQIQSAPEYARFSNAANRARSVIEVATVQNRYNLADRMHDDVLRYCERHGIGFIAFYPLAAGALAGSTAVGSIAARTGATPGQIALAWLLQRSPATILIPGTASLDHLEQNIAARDLTLTSDEVAALDQWVAISTD